MHAQKPTGFAIWTLTGLTWDEIDGYAAEVDRQHGDVSYRGHYLCTVFNDADGGDTIGGTGRHMSDQTVQRRINQIDRRAAGE